MHRYILQLALISWAVIMGGVIVYKMFHVESSESVDVDSLPEGKHFAIGSKVSEDTFNVTLYVKAPDKKTGKMEVVSLNGVVSGLDSNYSPRFVDFKATDKDCLSSNFQLLYQESTVRIMMGFGEVAARNCHMYGYLKDSESLKRVYQ